ncbi:MAG TPA: serine/threonine-protein kinase, partial [Pseudonocardiaceae bacterium]
PTTSDQPGNDRLIADRYRLGHVIGRGSMGIVWLAYDEVLHRAVAVKEVRLPPGMPAAEAASVRERTLREARAIAALTHPNVISVFDVARHNGEPYVVMELVASRSLAELIRKHGKCSIEQAALVADSVAAAREAAHRRGITHRDVKPGNVLIGDDGQIKLTDFGIARNMSEVTMTSSGLILGTPAFIAPEAAAGDPVTPAADLWGLGATLYAAITGNPPYDKGDDPVETITEVVHGEIPRLPVGSPLADVVSALMVKDPNARMSLVEVRRRTRSLLPDPGASVFPPNEPADPEDSPADNTPTRGLVSPVAQPQPPAPQAPAAPAAQLAADPGPLPFMVGRQRPRRRRGTAVTVALLVVAVLLFAGAAGGGFVAARTLAGRSLVPPPKSSTTSSQQPTSTQTPTVQLVPTTGSAALANGISGGRFNLEVPQGWQTFAEQRAGGTAVHYVKPDGTEELTVEWYPKFYPDSNTNDYLQDLHNIWPGSALSFNAETRTPIPGLPGGGEEQATELGYRTTDGSEPNQPSPNAHRTTYADLLPDGDDLWVVSMTVVTDLEFAGKGLFDQLKTSFAPTS